MNKLDHIGIAVKNLDDAIKFFENTYDAQFIWKKVFEDQKLESAFLKIGSVSFELSMPTEPGGVLDRFIEQKGEGIHHISMAVDDFKKATKKLQETGMRIIGETSTAEYTLAFIHPKTNLGVLMEIIERK